MDQLIKTYLFPFGCFDFCDSVGLDTLLWSIQNYIRGYPHKTYYSGMTETLSELISQGKLGMKTQEGFYKYPMVAAPVSEPPTAAEIVDHLRQTWVSSARRHTAQAHIPIDDANFAIKEYFDIQKGPFE
jgi:3-hydroxyacyl-CoA dehydrogenase